MKFSLSSLFKVKKETYIEYLNLCNPQLLIFVLFCSVVGLIVSFDGVIAWQAMLTTILPGILGIMLATASGFIYHRLVVTARLLGEEKYYPFHNHVCRYNACCFSLILGLLAVSMLAWVNVLILLLVWSAFLIFALLHSPYNKRKRRSKRLIGVGILSFAPVLGWSVVSSEINPQVLSLALVTFFWLHIYFWAAGFRKKFRFSNDAKVAIRQAYGILFIKKKIFIAAAMVYIFAMSPFLFNLSGELYILGAFILGIGLLQKSFALLIARVEQDMLKLSELLRQYALYYLPALFTLMVIDHLFFFNPQLMAGLL